jgi:organic hydroperoxide reductase OsmC/OhrA
MSEHRIMLEWRRGDAMFDYFSYSRDHRIVYSAEGSLNASAAPEYRGNPAYLNPEQAFVASLSSCHMLTFLVLAAKKGFVVDQYDDEAVAVLGKNESGQSAIVRVQLKPMVTFSGSKLPDEESFRQLLAQAHAGCFISNSIASCVRVHIDPLMRTA